MAATDNFRSSNVWCWISMDNIAMRFGFFYGPIWAAILWVTCSMAAIYYRFLVQERKNKRYQSSGQAGNNAQLQSTATNVIGRLQSTTNIGNTGMRSSTVSTSRSKSSKIAGQALCYVGSFYLTFLFPSWTRISQMMGRQPPFAVVAMFTIFFPMQGFYNALVFFRPKIKSYLSERRKKAEGDGGDDFQIETWCTSYMIHIIINYNYKTGILSFDMYISYPFYFTDMYLAFTWPNWIHPTSYHILSLSFPWINWIHPTSTSYLLQLKWYAIWYRYSLK